MRMIVLTGILTGCYRPGMSKARRITANLPGELLDAAMEVTGRGITETLVEGLQLVRRARAYERAMALKGKIDLKIDLDESRERRRR
jgi:hypothetical protein